MLAQYLHNLKITCRVGIARFQANVVNTSSCEKSRIGAFEVQIAYRDTKNQLHTGLLHSKLDTKVWLPNSGLSFVFFSFFFFFFLVVYIYLFIYNSIRFSFQMTLFLSIFYYLFCLSNISIDRIQSLRKKFKVSSPK